ncbi:MAG: hypothetical protein F2563_05215, partial [Actinobacteria bacterium]|nr:hypothetical protein [Actinomycetota bacterium]
MVIAGLPQRGLSRRSPAIPKKFTTIWPGGNMSNPVIERAVGEYAFNPNFSAVDSRPLTLDAVVNKAVLSAVFVGLGAVTGWTFAPQFGFGTVMLLAMVGLGLGLINSFKKQVSPLLVLAYALV